MLAQSLHFTVECGIQIRKQIEPIYDESSFDNPDSLLNYLIFDTRVGIIIIIDDQSEDFNALLNRLSDIPEVVIIKKYQYKNEAIYQYTPFKEGVSESEKASSKGFIELKDVDTIVCPAREDGFKHAFLNNHAWWAIRISPSLIPNLKYIAMYETNPVSQIRWYARIKQNGIRRYKNTGKYIVNVENKKRIGPIQLDKDKKGVAPQSPRYTTYEKLLSAKKISHLW